MTETVAVKLLTIVGEAVLTERLLRDLTAAGATGYTLSPASGIGSGHMNPSTLDGENTRIEALMDADAASRMLVMLEQRYFPYYAVVAWLSTVDVVRGHKYTARQS